MTQLKDLSGLRAALAVADVEKVVESAYWAAIRECVEGFWTAPEKCDGLLSYGNDRLLLAEFKLDWDLCESVARARVLVQSLYYMRRLGPPWPTVLFGGSKSSCFLVKHEDLLPYLDTPDVDWSLAACQAAGEECNRELYHLLKTQVLPSLTVYPVTASFDLAKALHSYLPEQVEPAKGEKRKAGRPAKRKPRPVPLIYAPEAGWFNNAIRQKVETPYDICREMVALVGPVEDKVVLTMNVEMLPPLLRAKALWFLADNAAKINFVEERYPGMVKIIPLHGQMSFLEMEMPVKFDIVVQNPPYQVMDGGHSKSAKPIYHKFIEKVIDELQPEFLVSINPSRWMIGGKGLDKFRTRMMKDKRIKVIVDDQSSSGIFPGVDIAGGVNYFLWDKNHNGKCTFNGVERDLDEYDIVLRENESRSILEKVLATHKGGWISEGASPRKPYGLEGDAPSYSGSDAVPCWFKQKIGLAEVNPKSVRDCKATPVAMWRVLRPYAFGGADRMHFVTATSIAVAKPGEYCTETYIVLRSLASEVEANYFAAYVRTRFFRFMLRLRNCSHHATANNYRWVPDLGDYSKSWTDAELYKMFGLTRMEQSYIASKIKELK